MPVFGVCVGFEWHREEVHTPGSKEPMSSESLGDADNTISDTQQESRSKLNNKRFEWTKKKKGRKGFFGM